MEGVIEQLKSIFPLSERHYSPVELECEPLGDDLVLKYARQYEAPDPLTLQDGLKLQKLFDAKDVRLQLHDISRPGCESCDWGSSYGHIIRIVAPKLHKNLTFSTSYGDDK